MVLGSFAALFHIDIPILRLPAHTICRRSNRWVILAKTGNGGTLITISVLLLGAGYLPKRQVWIRTAVDSPLAHGGGGVGGEQPQAYHRPSQATPHPFRRMALVALVTIGVRFIPSGHTSATVAVATVLARALPRLSWLPFALAAWVGASRIWRGSHFPGDVISAGWCWALWSAQSSTDHCGGGQLVRACALRIAPMVLLLTGWCWVVTHRILDPVTDTVLVASGVMLVLAGWLVQMLPQSRSTSAGGIAAVVTSKGFLLSG